MIDTQFYYTTAGLRRHVKVAYCIVASDQFNVFPGSLLQGNYSFVV